MKTTKSLLLIPMILLSTLVIFSTANAEEAEDTATEVVIAPAFTDVEEGNQYYVAINYLRENGIIQGYEDGTFKTKNEVLRAEALKMLSLASGATTVDEINNIETPQEAPFNDVDIEAWYIPYLVFGKERGIVGGYEDGSFKPTDNINLAESLKILLNAAHVTFNATPEITYDDTPLDAWFTNFTSYVGSFGGINIYKDNTVSPAQTMTRGYMAEVLYRFLRSKEGYKFGKATWYGGAVQGNGTASGEAFDKNSFTTAHPDLPFGTKLEVRNLANGKTVTVEVTDRGPYGPGRVLDLSSSAFNELASLGEGVIYVEYHVLN